MTAPSIVSVQSAPLVTTNTDVYTVQFPDTGVAVLLTSADVVVIYSTVADTVIFVNGYEDDIPT